MSAPFRQIRAAYDADTVRVYQAYSDAIADSALARGTFVSPPFSMTRMTWIKPSWLWMMYRAGWGHKDPGQARILALDLSRAGFEWALAHSGLSHFEAGTYASHEAWEIIKDRSPVRVQWDPERDLHLRPLPHRAIQIGLSGAAVALFVNEWIRRVTDLTPLAHQMHELVQQERLDEARQLLPVETLYPVDAALAAILGISPRPPP